MVLRCCLLHLIRQRLLSKSFPRILILMTQASFYLLFFSRTKLKLHNILLTLKLVRKVITNLDSLCFSGSSEELNLNSHIY